MKTAYVSELYPTSIRASGFGWASSVSRIATGFAPLLFGTLLWQVFGLPITFAIAGAPETRGRELDSMVAINKPLVAAHVTGE